MKTTRNILSIAIAAGAPGVALLAFTNLISADIALAIIAINGLVAFAAFDYLRTTKSLRPEAQILRPELPLRSNVVRSANLRRAA